MRVILESKVRKKPTLPIEAEAIIPRNFLKGTDLVVYAGNKERTLSELFWIFVEGTGVSPENIEVVLKGATSRIKRVGEYIDTRRILLAGISGCIAGIS